MSNNEIMIIEDSPTQALKLQLALQEEGFGAACFYSAEAALEALNTLRPRLIMVDYHLPGIQGDDLCRRVRMNINTQGVPILMLTMDEDIDAQLRGLESGADDYVSKNEDTKILMLRIHSLLRKSGKQASIIKPEEMFFRKARILIIDDSPTYSEYLSGELADEGYSVETASNSTNGLASAAKGNFDCVLIDLVMPEIDGIEVCRTLASPQKHGESTIIIFLISAHESKDNAMRALEAGADDFVGKSGDVSILKARIRALLRHKFLHDQTRKLIKEFRKREDDLERLIEERTQKLKEEVTVRKRAENTAREARKLAENANVAKSQFLANMSHELRTPLNAIIGFADAIRNEVDGPIGNETYRNYIENIYDSGRHLHEVIHDILDVSSIEAGQVHLKEDELDVVKVLRSAWNIVGHTAEKQAIQVVWNIDGGLPALYADERLLKQSYLNIVTNAIKFTKKGGCVTTQVKIDDNGSFIIRISDTGIGIPAKDIEKVLEPFGQVDSSLARSHQGTGLGLPIAKAFIELHGGTLELTSELGVGTTVVLHFPPDRVRG